MELTSLKLELGMKRAKRRKFNKRKSIVTLIKKNGRPIKSERWRKAKLSKLKRNLIRKIIFLKNFHQLKTKQHWKSFFINLRPAPNANNLCPKFNLSQAIHSFFATTPDPLLFRHCLHISFIHKLCRFRFSFSITLFNFSSSLGVSMTGTWK